MWVIAQANGGGEQLIAAGAALFGALIGGLASYAAGFQRTRYERRQWIREQQRAVYEHLMLAAEKFRVACGEVKLSVEPVDLKDVYKEWQAYREVSVTAALVVPTTVQDAGAELYDRAYNIKVTLEKIDKADETTREQLSKELDERNRAFWDQYIETRDIIRADLDVNK